MFVGQDGHHRRAENLLLFCDDRAGASRSLASALRTNTTRCGCELAVVGPHFANS